MRVLLGCNTDSRGMEDRIDHAFKRFLKRAWRIRKRLTHALNIGLDRQDVIDLSDAPGRHLQTKPVRPRRGSAANRVDWDDKLDRESNQPMAQPIRNARTQRCGVSLVAHANDSVGTVVSERLVCRRLDFK